MSIVPAGPVHAQPVVLADLCAVIVAQDAHPVEHRAAKLLRQELTARLGLRLATGYSKRCRSSLHLGSGAALASGLISAQEIAAIPHDGFRLRNGAGGVAIAGRNPAGTVYGAYEFLRRAGLRHYPWRDGGGFTVFSPPAGGTLPALDVLDAPFFQFRDFLTHLDNGRFGASLRELELGDLAFAMEDPDFRDRGWVNWDHTAGWLVPVARHGDQARLYAEPRLPRTLASTPTHEVAVCMCEPAVREIAAARALEWMGRQPGRRWFAITDGDVERPRCPACEPMDAFPDYYTDRLLDWVNHVAAGVAPRWPEKRLLTHAYLSTVKPPARVAPAPNVTVAYAPWFWTSRASSAVDLLHPLNITAAEELEAWTTRFPGQVGVYDYPGPWVFGTAARIRSYAERGVTWLYFNSPEGDLLHWVAARLMWQPFQSVEPLVREYAEAAWGPAAPALLAQLDLQRKTLATESRWSMDFFAGEDFRAGTVANLAAAGRLARADRDVPRRVRALDAVAEGYADVLRGLRRNADRSTLGPGTTGAQALAGYLEARRQVHRELPPNPDDSKAPLRHGNRIRAELLGLGYQASGPGADVPTLLAAYESSMARQAAVVPAADILAPRHLGLGNAAAGDWRLRGVAEPLPPAGEAFRFRARLASLPAGRRGGQAVHFGRAQAHLALAKPLAFTPADSVYLRLQSSVEVPATIYLRLANGRSYRADVNLQAGEQVVRVRIASFRDLQLRRHQLTGIALDLWPADLFHPHPRATDADLGLMELQLRGAEPSPDWLPRAGSGVWLTAFRANTRHGNDALERVAADWAASGADPAADLDDYRRSRGEDFRSFTPHRILTPLPGPVAGTGPGGGPAWAPVQGREAALANQRLTRAELAALPPGGAWIRISRGKVVVAGPDPGAEGRSWAAYLASQEATGGFLTEYWGRWYPPRTGDSVRAGSAPDR